MSDIKESFYNKLDEVREEKKEKVKKNRKGGVIPPGSWPDEKKAKEQQKLNTKLSTLTQMLGK